MTKKPKAVKPRRSAAKLTHSPRRKTSRQPSKKARAAPTAARRRRGTRQGNAQMKRTDDIARFIAELIKSQDAKPGTPLRMELLRPLLKPASDPAILAALEMLAAQGVVSQQPGNQPGNQWVVGGSAGPGP